MFDVIAPLIFWIFLFLALFLFLWWAMKNVGSVKSPARRYSRGLEDEQMVLDLRLTYKRFKELYPFSEITYEDYKRLQMERAFRRSVSSQKNKRMVR